MLSYKSILLYIILALIGITTVFMIIFICIEIYNKKIKRKKIIYSVNPLQIPISITRQTTVEFI